MSKKYINLHQYKKNKSRDDHSGHHDKQIIEHYQRKIEKLISQDPKKAEKAAFIISQMLQKKKKSA